MARIASTLATCPRPFEVQDDWHNVGPIGDQGYLKRFSGPTPARPAPIVRKHLPAVHDRSRKNCSGTRYRLRLIALNRDYLRACDAYQGNLPPGGRPAYASSAHRCGWMSSPRCKARSGLSACVRCELYLRVGWGRKARRRPCCRAYRGWGKCAHVCADPLRSKSAADVVPLPTLAGFTALGFGDALPAYASGVSTVSKRNAAMVSAGVGASVGGWRRRRRWVRSRTSTSVAWEPEHHLSQVPQTLGEESTSAPLCSTYAALMHVRGQFLSEGLRANGRAL